MTMRNSARYSSPFQTGEEYARFRLLISYAATKNQDQCNNTSIPAKRKSRIVPCRREFILQTFLAACSSRQSFITTRTQFFHIHPKTASRKVAPHIAMATLAAGCRAFRFQGWGVLTLNCSNAANWRNMCTTVEENSSAKSIHPKNLCCPSLECGSPAPGFCER